MVKMKKRNHIELNEGLNERRFISVTHNNILNLVVDFKEYEGDAQTCHL